MFRSDESSEVDVQLLLKFWASSSCVMADRLQHKGRAEVHVHVWACVCVCVCVCFHQDQGP